jgi:putative membrane protein
MEWFKTDMFLNSILFAFVGVFVFWICFIVIDKLTPYHLWTELVERKNVALAIVVGAMCLGISIIVAAAVHG